MPFPPMRSQLDWMERQHCCKLEMGSIPRDHWRESPIGHISSDNASAGAYELINRRLITEWLESIQCTLYLGE